MKEGKKTEKTVSEEKPSPFFLNSFGEKETSNEKNPVQNDSWSTRSLGNRISVAWSSRNRTSNEYVWFRDSVRSGADTYVR